MGLHQIIFDVDDYDDRDDMSKLFNSQDDDELDVIAPTSRWQLLSHAVGGSEVGLRDYTVHRIIFDDDDEDDRDDMSKLFNSQDDDELNVIAPTAPPSPSITRTERVKSKRQSRLQRELESSLDGVKWSSGTASPSLPITGVEGQEAISEGLKALCQDQRCGVDQHCENTFAHSGCTTLGKHDARYARSWVITELESSLVGGYWAMRSICLLSPFLEQQGKYLLLRPRQRKPTQGKLTQGKRLGGMMQGKLVQGKRHRGHDKGNRYRGETDAGEMTQGGRRRGNRRCFDQGTLLSQFAEVGWNGGRWGLPSLG